MRDVGFFGSARNHASLTADEEAETNDAGHDALCACDRCRPDEYEEHDVCPVAIGVAA